MKLHAATTVFLITAMAGNPLCAAGESVIRLRILGGRPVADGVFVNGNGPYRFLLDTGAQSNQIDAVIAGKIGLTPTFRVDLATTSGVTRVGGSRVREVTLGSLRASDQEFLFTALDGVRELSADIQGVLGEEFLSRFDYRLDLRAKTLDFGAVEPDGERIPTEQVAGRPALATNFGRLVLDSGSDTLVLFHNGGAGPALPGISAASGFAAAGSGLWLRIGGRSYRPGRAVAASNPEAAEDGLLPLSLFKAVYISNSGHYIVCE